MFGQFVVELLKKRPELQVVREASDGLEALQKAVELRPDLILLDIGLPSLNGIEVASQMRSLVPESKIIFLTQESSAEVMQKAFCVGARGLRHREYGATRPFRCRGKLHLGNDVCQ